MGLLPRYEIIKDIRNASVLRKLDLLIYHSFMELGTDSILQMADSSSRNELDSQVFDYVIIGGGTAGLVVAARLTEDPNVKVVVLEAGGQRLDVS